jgi:hypothetical protein
MVNTKIFLDAATIKDIIHQINPIDYKYIFTPDLANKLLEYFIGEGMAGKAIMESNLPTPITLPIATSVVPNAGDLIGTWKTRKEDTTAIIFFKFIRIVKATHRPEDIYIGVILNTLTFGCWTSDGKYFSTSNNQFDLVERISERS